jgi:hypothetical protein
MTRRGWVVALGSGLCAALLPACTHLTVDGGRAGPPPAAWPGPGGEAVAVRPPAPAPGRIPSPYQETAGPTDWPDALQRDPQVRRIGYPLLTPPPSPPSPPDPVPIAPPSVNEAGEEVQTGPPEPNARHGEEPPLVTALRCFLDKQPEEALQALGHYDRANQELLLGLLPLLAHLTEKAASNQDEVTQLVNQLDSLLLPLRARAALALDKMCFCRHIEKYGVYDPLPEGHRFHAGEPVQVYVELQNVSSRQQGDTYVSQLSSTVEIRDADNRLVFRQAFGDRDRQDVSRTLRHDYFNNYRFCVPDMPPGQYTLWIQVEDMQTRDRVARRWLDFPVTTVPGRGM